MAQIIAGFFFYGTFNDRPTHSIMCCLTQVKNTISRFRRQCLSVMMLGLTCLLVVMCLCAQFWRFIKKSIVLPHAIPECNLYIFQYLKNAFWLYNCVPSHIMCCWSMWKMWFVIIIIWKFRIGHRFDQRVKSWPTIFGYFCSFRRLWPLSCPQFQQYSPLSMKCRFFGDATQSNCPEYTPPTRLWSSESKGL